MCFLLLFFFQQLFFETCLFVYFRLFNLLLSTVSIFQSSTYCFQWIFTLFAFFCQKNQIWVTFLSEWGCPRTPLSFTSCACGLVGDQFLSARSFFLSFFLSPSIAREGEERGEDGWAQCFFFFLFSLFSFLPGAQNLNLFGLNCFTISYDISLKKKKNIFKAFFIVNHIEHNATRHFVLLCGGAARWKNPLLLSAIAVGYGIVFLFFFILFFTFLMCCIFQLFPILRLFLCLFLRTVLVSFLYVSSTMLSRFFHVSGTISSSFLLRFLFVSCTFLRRFLYVFPRVFHDSCNFVPRFLFVSVTFVKSVLDVSSTLLAIILYVSFFVIPCFSTFVLRFRAFSVSVFVGLFDSFVHVQNVFHVKFFF